MKPVRELRVANWHCPPAVVSREWNARKWFIAVVSIWSVWWAVFEFRW